MSAARSVTGGLAFGLVLQAAHSPWWVWVPVVALSLPAVVEYLWYGRGR